MPSVVGSLPQLREAVAGLRARAGHVGFVPTMGNLHRGHLSLVDEAFRHAGAVVASIFVNPTQFGPGEDFDAYPRTLEADLEALDWVGCDLVWAPPADVMYPLEDPFMLRVPEGLSNRLCGRSRPGHFDGVATVVLRLLSQVAPDVAVFGEKDYQQLLILKRMAQDCSLPVEVRGAPIVREADGLAMSSRNGYLDERERAAAPLLNEVLREVAECLGQGRAFDHLKPQALSRLKDGGFRPDYLEWCSSEDLGEPREAKASRVFGAAWLGKARLIDNVEVPAARD